MSVNGIAFYVVAALALVAAAGVVGLPSLRLAAYALAAFGAAAALVFLILGNELLFAAELLVYGLAVPALVLSAVSLMGARDRNPAGAGTLTAWWPVALLTGLGTAALLLGVAAVSTHAWSQGTYPSDSTVTQRMGELIFGTYALPFATSAVLLLTALVGAVVIGRRDDLEAELEAAERERRQREERMRRRREDRERARRAARPAAVGGEEAQ